MATYPAWQVEVGYLLQTAYWVQDYAIEICARLLRFAFEQTTLEDILATTDPDNDESRRVLRKCVMRSIGLRRAPLAEAALNFAPFVYRRYTCLIR